MRGSIIGRRCPGSSTFLGNPTGAKQAPFFSSLSSPFSTSSGRGRGAGGSSPSDSPLFDFTPKPSGNPTPPDDSKPPESSPSIGLGLGRGRGKPIHSDPILPAFTSFISSIKPTHPASGHGRGVPKSTRSQPLTESAPPPPPPVPSNQSVLPEGLSVKASAGRGHVVTPAGPAARPQPSEENRHVRPRSKSTEPALPKMSQEEAVKKLMTVMGGKEGEGREGTGRGRGRGRGRERGRPGKGRDTWMKTMGQKTEEEDTRNNADGSKPWEMKATDGDIADAEKFAERVGPEVMSALEAGFEEMSARVLPSVVDDEYVEALHTNCMIEFEPEYLMGEFHQNPDIDEKPPIPLEEFLEKVKPFMMAYEGIQSQEEWEEVVKETMEKLPLLKEIVDNYSGPDRITAKKQVEELERVANTIPASAPASMKQFTDRALLSLQSNPGWKYNRKFQFMDKLVREVTRFK